MVKVHMCEEPRCHNIIPFNHRWCDVHASQHMRFNKISHDQRLEMYKKYNAERRDPEANAFYQSKQWKAVRAFVVNRDYYTSAISHRVIPNKQLIVDHIVPRRLCDDPLDTDNLWCLSRGEHTIKTRLEESIAAKPNGDNKLKHISKSWWQKAISEKIKNKNFKK